MNTNTLYLGLDVHKDSIVIAIAEPGPKGEIRSFGTITNDVDRLEKALGRLRKAHPGVHLEIAYEAGPCGFVIARRLKQLEVPCLVAAPSLIPKQPGSPFKTDKRDARASAWAASPGAATATSAGSWSNAPSTTSCPPRSAKNSPAARTDSLRRSRR